MDKISRRLFLKGGVAGLTALALGSETALAARTEVPGKALDGRLVKNPGKGIGAVLAKGL